MNTLELFKSGIPRTKEDLLLIIEELREMARRRSSKDTFRPASYYARLDEMFLELKSKIEKTHLFFNLEDWWGYAIWVGSPGMKVTLDYYLDARFDAQGILVSAHKDTSFEIASVPSRLLLVEEYAKLFDVESPTIRQWIRRGKIRTAIKSGREWRIPELTNPPRRGYSPGEYVWTKELEDAPEGFEYLREPASVYIDQKKPKSEGFTMQVSRDGKRTLYDLSTLQRELLECYFIANPAVTCTTEGYVEYR